jgi:hypothetical protein
MLHNIVEVRAMRPHRLHVTFDDGVVGELDVAQLVRFNGILRHSKSSNALPESFDHEIGTVCGPNGADLDPVVIYSTITGMDLPRSIAQPSASVHDLLCFAIKNKRLFPIPGLPTHSRTP